MLPKFNINDWKYCKFGGEGRGQRQVGTLFMNWATYVLQRRLQREA